GGFGAGHVTTGLADAAALEEPKAIFFHPPEDTDGLAGVTTALTERGITARTAYGLTDVGWIGDTPAVLVLTQAMLDDSPDPKSDLVLLPDSMVIIAADDATAAAAGSERVFLVMPQDRDAALRTIAGAYRLAGTTIAAARAERE